MNSRFLQAIGLAVIVLLTVLCGAWLFRTVLDALSNFVDWVKYNALPFAIGSAAVSAFLYVVYTAATNKD